MSERKVVRRSVAVAFGVICIVLMGGFCGAMLYTVTLLNDKDKQLTSLGSQISDQNNTISALGTQLSQAHVHVVTVEEIAVNTSAWLNRTVAVEGNLSGPLYQLYILDDGRPFNYGLKSLKANSENRTVSIGVACSGVGDCDSVKAIVIGVVRDNGDMWGPFISADSVIMP